jgi:putative FmdB family regulatory protein
MPTYEYVCTSCGHRLEAVQSFSDPALTVCPDCQGVLRKVFGNVGIVLKGSGFYKNDSRTTGRSNGSSGAPKDKESNSSSDSATKDSGTKDSGSAKETTTSTPSTSSSGDSGSSGSTEKTAPSKV